MGQSEIELRHLHISIDILATNSSRRVVNWSRACAIASRLSNTTAEAHRPSRRSTMTLLLQNPGVSSHHGIRLSR